MRDRKTWDWKMQDKNAGVENAAPENTRPISLHELN